MIGQVWRVSSYPWFTVEPPFDFIVLAVSDSKEWGKIECLLLDADTKEYTVTKHGVVFPVEHRFLRPLF